VSLGSLRQQVDFASPSRGFLGRDLRRRPRRLLLRYDLSDYSAYETSTGGMGLRLNFPLTSNAGLELRYTIQRRTVEIAQPVHQRLGLAILCRSAAASSPR
jgi:outer membrane protein insertion porin family